MWDFFYIIKEASNATSSSRVLPLLFMYLQVSSRFIKNGMIKRKRERKFYIHDDVLMMEGSVREGFKKKSHLTFAKDL